VACPAAAADQKHVRKQLTTHSALRLAGGASPGPPMGVAAEKVVDMVIATPGGVAISMKLSGGVLLSHTLPGAVPSALESLASGFGMGPGVSPPL
jgi:hypothetical protein